MDFWDEVYKKVSTVADYTAKETGKLSEVAKLKFSLMREKARLEEAYKRIGELYYKQIKNGDVSEKKLALAYDRIEKHIIEIERLETEINLLSNTKVCFSCGEKLDKAMAFCPKCGANQNAQNDEDEEEVELEIELEVDTEEEKA